MNTDFSGAWLLKGHFDLSGQSSHKTTTLQIKDVLIEALALPKNNGLQVWNYPPGQVKKHTYWWRQTELPYGEAQFVAQIGEVTPGLSLSVGIEKGRETGVPGPEEMDRSTWDWPRLIQHAPNVFAAEVPRVAAFLGVPVNVTVWSKEAAVEHMIAGCHTRAFSFVAGQWFERRANSVVVTADTITEHVQKLDQRGDTWVMLQFTHDLGVSVSEADGLTPAQAAEILLQFNGIRKLLRGHNA